MAESLSQPNPALNGLSTEYGPCRARSPTNPMSYGAAGPVKSICIGLTIVEQSTPSEGISNS
jgi:hypothetical protein